MFAIGFHRAFLVLALLYAIVGVGYLAPDLLARYRAAHGEPPRPGRTTPGRS
jgi:hypothetical protein